MTIDVIFWGLVFIAALTILVRGARLLVTHAETVGLARGLSPFIVGVTIIGIGTSLPELVAALIASIQNVTEFVPANAVGSNIANILLVLGLTGVVTRNFFVQKNLIYLDLPLLLIATILFIFVAADTAILPDGENGLVITRGESIFLILAYLIYIGYSFSFQDDYIKKIQALMERPRATAKNYVWMLLGGVGVIVGAKLVVDSTVQLSELLGVGVGVISMFVIALGTSLPELFVSLQAARMRKPELAFGNILGSSLFNMLMLVGLPGLLRDLQVDEPTATIGIPFLLAATVILLVSGITNKIHLWDGAMFIMLYVLFVSKLFGLF